MEIRNCNRYGMRKNADRTVARVLRGAVLSAFFDSKVHILSRRCAESEIGKISYLRQEICGFDLAAYENCEKRPTARILS